MNVEILFLAIVATLLGVSIGKSSKKHKRQLDREYNKLTIEYNTQVWKAIVTTIASQETPTIDVSYSLEWIEIESSGNPCAIGEPILIDGYPQEMGIGQVYNPDYIPILNIDVKQIRSYCGAGTSSQVTRLLTPDEMTYQTKLLMDLIKYCERESGHYLLQANVIWGSESKNYWKMVKLWHALPSLVKSLPLVTKKLGRPPNDWSEFVSTMNTFGPSYGGKVENPTPQQIKAYNRAWTSINNANRCGEAFVGNPIV